MRRPLIMKIAMCNKTASIFSKVEREWKGSNWLHFFYIHFYSNLDRRLTCFVAYRKLIFSTLSERSSHYEICDVQQNYCSRECTVQSKEVLIWDSISIRSFLNDVPFLFQTWYIWLENSSIGSWLQVIEVGSEGPKTSLLVPRSSLSWLLILSPPILPRLQRIVCRLHSILQTTYLWIRREYLNY